MASNLIFMSFHVILFYFYSIAGFMFLSVNRCPILTGFILIVNSLDF